MTARRLITAADVDRARAGGRGALDVPAGAIVTPLARDAARRSGLALRVERAPGRRRLVYGNWKGNPAACAEAVALGRAVAEGVAGGGARGCEVAVFPTFAHLAPVAAAVRGAPTSAVAIGAQDLSPLPPGATTGAVPGEALRDLGCATVLVGHSERRRLFGDGPEVVARKLGRALECGLRPVLCVGETLEERDAARTHSVLRAQLLSALDGLEAAAAAARLVVAYEPVWAIGTGVTPSPGEAEDALSALRDHLARRLGDDAGAEIPLLYGGSVTAANAARFFALPSCDGALVGGASLKAKEFLALAAAAAAVDAGAAKG